MAGTICIGPICIPINALIPFLVIFARPILSFFLGLVGIQPPQPAPLDPTSTVKKRTSPFEGVVHITSTSHWKTVLATAQEKDLAVIVDCTATWCGPCKFIAPYFESLSKAYDGVFAKVDVDECDELAASLGIRAMPTFLAFVEGKEQERFSGANKSLLAQLVNKLCAKVVVEEESPPASASS